MRRALVRSVVVAIVLMAGLITIDSPAVAECGLEKCPDVNLEKGDVTTGLSGSGVGALVGADSAAQADYAWRLRTLCMLSDEANGDCSPLDFPDCPQVPDRAIGYYVVQQRPVVRLDGTAVIPVPPGFQPGDLLDQWTTVSEGCLDITALNPPPSSAEVFSYFQRLPLPTLTTKHQPPGDGLSGLPVIFYTDSPTTQMFTVDIRGFTVVIQAAAESFIWHTGDPATPTLTSTDPGRPYPDQTIEHSYRSGTYTASLTVTWGATFTVNGGAAADVAGTTTTEGPPVTFGVRQARTVLTNPYD
jgi:hypothetical protein